MTNSLTAMKSKAAVVVTAIVYTSAMFGVWQWSVPAGLWMFGLLAVVLMLLVEFQ